jgi:hypothetical protein
MLCCLHHSHNGIIHYDTNLQFQNIFRTMSCKKSVQEVESRKHNQSELFHFFVWLFEIQSFCYASIYIYIDTHLIHKKECILKRLKRQVI